MQDERDTIPTSDAGVPTQPGITGGVVVDFDTYRKWILKDATALDVVEKIVGFE